MSEEEGASASRMSSKATLGDLLSIQAILFMMIILSDQFSAGKTGVLTLITLQKVALVSQ